MLVGCIGVFIAAKGYDFGGVDLGFLILLGVSYPRPSCYDEATYSSIATASSGSC